MNHFLSRSPTDQRVASRELYEDDVGFLLEEFQKYQSELFGTLYFLLGNREDAADALQESFLRIWKNREQFPEIENTRAWFFRIAINVGRDIRKNAWNRKKQNLPDEEGFLVDRKPSPEEVCGEEEQIRRIRTAVHELEESQKEIFLLRENGEFTYEQIAELLGSPVGTIKTRMKKALEILRFRLKE